VLQLIQYIFNINREHANLQELIRIFQNGIYPTLEKEMTNLTQKIMDEGRQKGKLQEKRETAENLLKENCDPAFVMKITGLSSSEIAALPKKLSKHGAPHN
jgi:predicted transposase/invertase (TIGR01784 family)